MCQGMVGRATSVAASVSGEHNVKRRVVEPRPRPAVSMAGSWGAIGQRHATPGACQAVSSGRDSAPKTARSHRARMRRGLPFVRYSTIEAGRCRIVPAAIRSPGAHRNWRAHRTSRPAPSRPMCPGACLQRHPWAPRPGRGECRLACLTGAGALEAFGMPRHGESPLRALCMHIPAIDAARKLALRNPAGSLSRIRVKPAITAAWGGRRTLS